MPGVNSNLGLDDNTSLKEKEVDRDGEVASFDDAKQEILEPYIKWIGDQNKITQILIIFIFIPFLLSFLHHSATIFAGYFWGVSWNSFWESLLDVWLFWYE